MRKNLLFVLAAILCMHISSAQTVEEKRDRIMASYLAAFGVLPQEAEMAYWVNDPLSSKTVNDLVNEHKKNIANQQELQDRAIRNSYYDAFGRAPAASEFNTWRPLKLTYADLMERHVSFLRQYPSSFEEVIKLSYVREFNRQPVAIELANWKNAGVRTYLSIVQQHQKNKKAGMFANASSSKVQSSKQSGVVFQPSTKISQEMTRVTGSGVIATGGGNVISTGGGNVISTGGGNVISTGGGN